MRIPHIINLNTLAEFQPSPDALDLIGENERGLVAENFEWNKDHCPTLADCCVQTISKHFDKYQILDELPCMDRDHLLEILSHDLPLEVAVPVLNDEYYWQQRYKAKFGLILRRKPANWTWKNLYMERHVQEIIEYAQPQYNDEETLGDILDLCAPYVERLIITQLQSWKPPLTMEKEDIPETFQTDHVNFIYILRKLPLITELDIVYGVNSVGEGFSWNMFQMSVLDCQRLGKAILDLTNLEILRIHRSRLEYKHCQALIQNLIKNNTIVELDLSHCDIGDQGALCVAKFIQKCITLKILNLSNNLIRNTGAEGIGYIMTRPKRANLEVLNLRLNPLGTDGVMNILRALVRCDIPKELSLSGCQFKEDTIPKVALMLKMNESLKKLDISNNWIGKDGGELLIEGLEENNTLEWLDIRDTDITPQQMVKIEGILSRNRDLEEYQRLLEEKGLEMEVNVTYFSKETDHKEYIEKLV
ncbi:hypothetical protein NQ315_010641 [Exocentrus adspersus]|uniref:T-complex-associated testis-expressed protein 1 n=1 Tax=Exocentrus adspersus TaxID=1586481 RepID=A0AAV8W787_9CUCU|nr:hypothetical protein NQ315_010641 [Exocentrus adspersus]